MMKKIIGLTLTLVMVLSLVQLPASAAVTSILSATIEGRASGNAKALYNEYSTSARYYVDDGSAGTGTIARTQGKTSVSEVERSVGKTALKFVSGGEVEDAISTNVELSTSYTVQTNDVLHFSIDFKTEDMNCDKTLRVRHKASSWSDFLKFTADGKITLYNKFVDTYSLNKWYEIDAYYNTADDFWYLFINNELAKRIKNDIGASIVQILGATWTAPLEKTTTVYLDDIVANAMTAEDLAAKLPGFYAGFDNYNSSTTTFSYYFSNDASGESMGGGIDKNTSTTASVYEHTTGDNAVKFVSIYSDKASDYLQGGKEQFVSDGDVFHFGVDFKAEDVNSEKSVMLRSYYDANSDGTFAETNDEKTDSWNFIKFKTDGTITLWNNVVALWNINTWYEVDVYGDKENNLWYVYINDEFCASVSMVLNYDKISLARLSWPVKDTVGSVVHVDNFLFGLVSKAQLNALLPQAPSANSLLAVRNTVDTNSILINAAGPEMTGTLIAALYNGTGLAEVKTVNAADAAYVTFTKEGNNAKIMWWNGTEGDITPKAVAVPVSFAAAN